MRKIYPVALICLFINSKLFAQGICNPAGNIIIYSNYDGGTLNINIDENVPDIKLGICSYEGINVTISGTYVGNITEVLYAGYNDIPGTTITGVDPGLVTILVDPPATFDDPDGYPFIICAYECDTSYIPGGCNTVDQITYYFLSEFSGSLRYSYMQYVDWGTGTYNISDGGNCCFDAACSIAINAGQDVTICEGDSTQLFAEGAVNYAWFPNEFISDNTISNPAVYPLTTTTYIVTGSNADGCTGIDSVIVNVVPKPVATISFDGTNLFASGGVTYQWYYNGNPLAGETSSVYTPGVSGNYYVIITNDIGCSSESEILNIILEGIINNTLLNGITIYPNPVSDILQVQIQNTVYGVGIIELASVTGKIIKTLSFTKSINDITVNIDCNEIPAGLYFIYTEINNRNAERKMISVMH